MVLGAALFYAWNLYSIYCGSVISSDSFGAIPNLSVIVTGVAATVSFIAIACCFYRMRAFYTAGLIISVLAGLATPMGLFIAWAFDADPSLVRLVVDAICRIGSSWVIVSWGAQFARLDPFSITVNILSTFAVALLACLAMMFCPYVVRAAFVSLALPVSMAFLAKARHRGECLSDAVACQPVGTSVCSETFVGLTWRVIVVFFLFGIVTWLSIMSNRTGDSSSFASGVVILAGSTVVVLPLLVVALLKRAPLSESYTYKVVFPLVMSGVLLMGVVGAEATWCWPLISIGYTCFDLFCFALYANACRRTGTNALMAYGWCRAIESAVPLVALAVTGLFGWATDGGSETVFLDLVVPAAIFAILAMIALDREGLFESGRINSAIVYPQAGVLYFARQCQEVINRYALSPREAEVLSLIVRGRSVPHISQRLGISNSTTKTHVSHIYEKLGVCDRQEMIDLIESCTLPDASKAAPKGGES